MRFLMKASRRGVQSTDGGSLALEFLILLPFLVALSWMVLWSGETGRAGLVTSLAAEEAATVAVLARQRGLTPEEALQEADEYIRSRNELWDQHCINVDREELDTPAATTDAVGAAWWSLGDPVFLPSVDPDGNPVLDSANRPVPRELSRGLGGKIWIDYVDIDAGKVYPLELAVVKVRCESRVRFALPITFASRSHEALAWEPVTIPCSTDPNADDACGA